MYTLSPWPARSAKRLKVADVGALGLAGCSAQGLGKPPQADHVAGRIGEPSRLVLETSPQRGSALLQLA